MGGGQALNLGCGRLPKIAAVLLLSDAVLDSGYDPERQAACRSNGEVEEVIQRHLALLDDSNG